MILRRFGIALAVLLVLVVATLAAGRYWLLHTESGARFAWRQAEGALGGAMSAAGVSGSISDGLLITEFRFVNDAVIVDIGRFAARAEVSVLPAGVRVLQPQAELVRVEVLPSQDDAPGRTATEIVELLNLPLDLEIHDLAVSGAVVSGVTADEIAIDQASAAEIQWLDSIDVDALAVESPIGRFRGGGRLSLDAPYRFDASTNVAAPIENVGTVSADASASGAVGSLVEGQGEVRAENQSVVAEVRFNWNEGGRLAGFVEVARLELHRFVEQWPSSSVVSGRAGITVSDAGFDIDGLEFASSNTDLRITANGGVDMQSARVSGEIDWQGFQWPLIGDEPVFRSDEGDVDLSGSLDDWSVYGSIHVGAIGVDDGEFLVRGGGDRTQVTAEILESRILGGTASGQVSYSWTGPQPWSAVVDLQGIQTGLLEDRFAGTVSGHLDLRGQSVPFELDATLESVDGALRGRELSANGRVLVKGAVVSADQLAISHGDSHFLLDGSVQDDAGLKFDLSIDDLGEYVEDAMGTLTARGTVSLDDERPFLDVDASTPFVSWRDIELQGLRVENVDAGNAIDVVVMADSVAVAGTLLADSRAAITINPDQQSLRLATLFDDASIDFGVNGAFEDWQSLTNWNGNVTEFVLAVPDLPAVELLGTASIKATQQNALLESFCFGTGDDAKLCLRAEWAAGAFADVEAKLDALPVDIVNLFRDSGFRFDQTLDGEVNWRQERGKLATGFANIRATAGRITNDERPDIVMRTDPGNLSFDVVDGKVLSGVLQLPMPGTGQIDGSFAVVDVARGLDSNIEGHLQVDMNNMALLAIISPIVDEAAGDLLLNLEVSGTGTEPVVTGDMKLVDGSLGYLPLGLRIRDLNLEGTLMPDRKIEVTGSFRSNEGRGEVVTSADTEYGMTTGAQIEIRGQGLQIIDLPDISAIADVDLDLGFDGRQLNIAGRVKIPQARIVPTNLGEGRVLESEDVVIVAGELPDEEAEEPESDLQVYGALEFELGDNVVIELAVARATATGKADFSWDGDPLPVANGRYTIEGEIQAFGQVLSITEGNVRYPNVPADDPLIRLFAEREIYGNPQVKTAGVLVAGSLRRPTIEAYTTPLTTEERALALLVTGSDFDYEQGVGAIDFGTYIAPRLFVSYGVGIFDRDNVISARYDLTEGFGIKATSGQKESGVDITYRIER